MALPLLHDPQSRPSLLIFPSLPSRQMHPIQSVANSSSLSSCCSSLRIATSRRWSNVSNHEKQSTASDAENDARIHTRPRQLLNPFGIIACEWTRIHTLIDDLLSLYMFLCNAVFVAHSRRGRGNEVPLLYSRSSCVQNSMFPMTVIFTWRPVTSGKNYGNYRFGSPTKTLQFQS